ncbi:hypothetical protein FRB97_005307 [Tulasnella sp. 331]|nr:hypothetical protein FRB97_005307 [Tulasnella sp. 331]
MAATASVQELYDAILRTRTADPSALRSTEAALQELVTKCKGVLLGLQTIAITPSLDLSARSAISSRSKFIQNPDESQLVRQLAIIQAKNATPLQWKSKVKTAEEDLPVMRRNMLHLVDEPDAIIAKNNEAMAANAVRFDYPTRWPSVFTDITNVIQSSLQIRLATASPDNATLLRSRRSLSLLNAVLKVITSMKSPLGTQLNTKALAELYPFLSQLVPQTSSQVQGVLNASSINNAVTAHDIEVCRLSWKCWFKVMVWAWSKSRKWTPEEEQALWTFFAAASSQLHLLWEYRSSVVQAIASTPNPNPNALQCLELLTKQIKSFGKAFRRMQQHSIARFVKLPGCNALVLSFWGKVLEAAQVAPDLVTDEYTAVHPVRLVVQSMAIFKESLASWSPKKNASAMEMDSPTEILSRDFVTQAVSILVTRFIPLKPADLERWQEDPEEFLNADDKESELWEFDTRPCSERVLMTLANQYPDFVEPLLQQLFQTVLASSPTSLDEILQREASYCALGRCTHRLKDRISFGNWLPVLAKEARDSNPLYRLMKRRIAWLIGKWHVENKRESGVSKQIWEILLFLLSDRSEASDPAVRLTAVVSVSECVDNNDFVLDDFLPFMGQYLAALFLMIDEAEATESKNRIIKSMNCIIGQARQQVAPLIQPIIEPLPRLWTAAGTDYMLKQSLLILVKELIDATREHSAALHSLVVPLVQESLLPANKPQLDDDGFALWVAALQQCKSIQVPAGQPGLFDLFPALINLLANDLDQLGTINTLLESYYIQDTATVLQQYAPQLLKAYAETHGRAVSTNIQDITQSVEMMLQLSPSAMSWAPAMHTSGLFVVLLDFALKNKGSPVLVCDHFYVFSRMALQDAGVFMQLLVESAPLLDESVRCSNVEDTIDKVMDLWWRNFDSMAESRYRKLTAMTMACLATTGRPEIVRRLSNEIANIWLDVLGEIREALLEDPDNPSYVNAWISAVYEEVIIEPHSYRHLNTYWTDNGGQPPMHWMRNAEEAVEGERRIQIWKEDPVQSVKLTRFVNEKLKATAAAMGQDVFDREFIKKTDPTVLEQLMGYLNEQI